MTLHWIRGGWSHLEHSVKSISIVGWDKVYLACQNKHNSRHVDASINALSPEFNLKQFLSSACLNGGLHKWTLPDNVYHACNAIPRQQEMHARLLTLLYTSSISTYSGVTTKWRRVSFVSWKVEEGAFRGVYGRAQNTDGILFRKTWSDVMVCISTLGGKKRGQFHVSWPVKLCISHA